MKEEFIKDFYGRILGTIETDSSGDQTARNFPGRQVLGFYRAKQNVTTDFYGRVISQGNTVIALIYNKK